MRSSNSVRYIVILLILIILLYSNIVLATGKQFDIIITDLSNREINEIDEKEHFKVGVFDFDQNDTPYLIDVNIEFNGLPYIIGESAEIILQAPEVDSDRLFAVFAYKEGYNSSNKTIKVLNNVSKQLDISTDDVVEADRLFSVYVYDENGDPVPNAIVGIERVWDERDETDDEGRAWLTAPEDKDTIKIIAQKDGYIQDEVTIRVNIPPPWWESLIKSWYFPILISTIILILVVLYVNFRQKKSIYTRAKEISDNKTIEKPEEISLQKDKSEEKQESQYYSKDAVRAQPDEDSKVEEIRISRPRKEKEIVPVEIKEDKTEKVINRKKIQRRDYDWFEGTDNIRYEIDKLTGEIDEEGLDKWYEGVDNLKEKIDEKVKKKDKKKDEEDEE